MTIVSGMGVAQATETNGEPIPFKAMAKVWLDEEGVPQRVEAPEQLPTPVREAIESQVKDWRFQPATVDGEARAGVTYLALDACAVPAASGDLNLAVGYSFGGPMLAGSFTGRVMPPRYPPEAVRASAQGEWVVTYQILPDGTVQWISMAPEGKTNPKTRRYFEPVLRAWVAGMRYLPEEVDGRPVGGEVSMPVQFKLDLTKTDRRALRQEINSSAECIAAMKGEETTRPLVVGSPFKLIDGG